MYGRDLYQVVDYEEKVRRGIAASWCMPCCMSGLGLFCITGEMVQAESSDGFLGV